MQGLGLAERAAEVAQEVFLWLYRSATHYDARVPLTVWLAVLVALPARRQEGLPWHYFDGMPECSIAGRWGTSAQAVR